VGDGQLTAQGAPTNCDGANVLNCGFRLRVHSGRFTISGIPWVPRMKPSACLFAFVLLASASMARAETALCFRGGKFVDPERKTIESVVLQARDGFLVSISRDPAAPCEGTVIDLRHRYIVPGFIDTHVHGWGNPSPTGESADEEWGSLHTAKVALGAGVVAFLDMASESDNWKARDLARNSNAHARIFSALMLSSHGSDAATVRRSFRTQLERKPDLIKLFAGGEMIGVLADEAKKEKLKTVVHISSWEDADAAVRAGVSAITHLEDERVIPMALAKQMAARGNVAIPTLAVQCDMNEAGKGAAWLADPLLERMIGAAMLARYRDSKAYSDKAKRTMRWQNAGCRPNDFPSIRILKKAGVSILAGSDTGNLGVFQGYSVHREMALLAEAGLANWEALQAGTTSAARFLGYAVGLKVGAPATFVVLERNPIENIRNTSALSQVVLHGRVVWKADAPR